MFPERRPLLQRTKNHPALAMLPWAALVAWFILTLIICIRAGHSPTSRSVYPVYTRAAHNWINGRDLYAGSVDFRYSPPVAAAFVPFAILPDGLGATLWRLVSVGVFLLAFGWWTLALLPEKIGPPGVGALFLLTIPLTAASLNNGQVNPLLVGLLMASVAAAAIDAWTLACVFVVLAAALKVYPAALGLLLLLLFPRRVAVRLLLITVIAIGLSFLLRNGDYVLARYHEWIHALRTDHRDLARIEKAPTDFRLLLRRCFGAPAPAWLYAALQATSAAAVAVLVLVARRRHSRKTLLLHMFGFACCWMLLFGPATEGSTFAILAPTAAWLVIAPLYTPKDNTSWAFGLAGYALLFASQIVGWFPVGAMVQSWGIAPMGTLLVMFALIRTALRGKAIPPGTVIAHSPR